MEFNGSEATFVINMVGGRTKQTYMGEFKVKCLLSPLEEIAADRKYREMLGSNSYLASERVKKLAFALSQLEQRIIHEPPFWKSEEGLIHGNIEDDDVILEVLDKAIEAQEKFTEMKEEELKKKEKELAERIKNKQVEKEPEVDTLGDNEDQSDPSEQDPEIDVPES